MEGTSRSPVEGVKNLLLKDGERTIEIHVKKDSSGALKYHVRAMGLEKGIKEFKINAESWQNKDDNPFVAYLKETSKQKNDPTIIDIWEKLENSYTDSIGQILHAVTEVIDYGIQSGVDIFIGTDVFRVKKADFVNSTNFQIWYFATKYRLPKIEKNDWGDFLAQCLKIARQEKHDPLAPDLLDLLLEEIKEGEIHQTITERSYFCEHVARYLINHADKGFFVLDKADNYLYVPKSVTTHLRNREKISQKSVRQFLLPYLVTGKDVLKWAGKGNKGRGRYWVFNIEKLYEYDHDIEVIYSNMIDCNKAGEEDEE